MLKKVLIGLAILIAIPLIAALFIKKDFSITREVTIAKPNAEVFSYIKNIKNQDNFSKWNKMDSTMEKTYTGEDGTVGFVYAWKSTNKDVGAGEQEIKKITEGSRLDMELRFTEPFASQAACFMSTTPVDSTTTKVAWGFEGNTPYPFNFMCLFMDMDKMIGDDLQTGLDNLKEVMEKQ